MTDIAKSIQAINEQAEFYITNENIDTIQWLNGTTPIAKQTILNKQKELQTEYKAKQYQRQRAKEYPDFKEYLDGIVKGDQAQIDKYIADCLAVKAKYPK